MMANGMAKKLSIAFGLMLNKAFGINSAVTTIKNVDTNTLRINTPTCD
jgi:hypothetical protein